MKMATGTNVDFDGFDFVGSFPPCTITSLNKISDFSKGSTFGVLRLRRGEHEPFFDIGINAESCMPRPRA
jgi:hypothetical protein